MTQTKQMPEQHFLPKIIQGGMGVGISGWKLARAVALAGQLGVVSGTALDQIFARKLQLGDPDGHLRRAMTFFPDLEMVRRIKDVFYLPKGKQQSQKFKAVPMFSLNISKRLKELAVVAAFSEVFLAKEGHSAPIGINLLEKIQLPNIFTIYGAMLAGVDYVFMGAGIPNEIPGIIDRLTKHLDVSLKIFVQNARAANKFRIKFTPQSLLQKKLLPLKRPQFFPIISSATLARMMLKKATGVINGFVVETSSAGGHNAPPRGKLYLTSEGEPVYGPRDEIEIGEIKTMGLPFWLAGSWGSPEKLSKALSIGADGIQAGTAFAFCEEAGLSEQLKNQVIQNIIQGKASVFTDTKASPTHFPFKVLGLKNTLSERNEYMRRKRICDLGYMRSLYVRSDGRTGYRCPAEPMEAYVKKGGKPEGLEDKKCLCNALLSNIGLGQLRKDGYVENSLITAGQAILSIARLLKSSQSYCARDVVDWLLTGVGSRICADNY
jgi:nitronate monooxygenase